VKRKGRGAGDADLPPLGRKGSLLYTEEDEIQVMFSTKRWSREERGRLMEKRMQKRAAREERGKETLS